MLNKIFFTTLLFISSNLVFGQEGYKKLPARFYSLIDSTHKFNCCDSGYSGISLTYEIPLYELPYSIIDLKEYEDFQMAGNYIDSYVQDLVDAYFRIKPKIRNQITKSCYKLDVDYKISKDLTDDGYFWVEGTLKIKITFQSNQKDFGKPICLKLRDGIKKIFGFQ